MEKAIEHAMAGGAQYAEVRRSGRTMTSLEMKDGELKRLIRGRDEGVGLRVLYGGAWGFASTNDTSAPAMLEAADLALRLARGASTRVREKVALAGLPPASGHEVWKAKDDPRDLEAEEKLELLMDMEAAAKGRATIHSVTTGFTDFVDFFEFGNSDGTRVYAEVPRTLARTRVTARENGNVIAMFASVGGTGGMEVFEAEDPVEKSGRAGESAARMLRGEKSPSGKMTVVVDYELAGVFAHEAIGHASEADGIVVGASCLEGKVGERIGNPGIGISDSPVESLGFGSFPFDHEGTPGRKKRLVVDGVVREHILNRETAGKLGMAPNGGARAENYASVPLVRMSNTFFENGTMAFEELLEGIDRGVYAKGSRGGQVDPSKGDFQFMALEAFLIENGQVTKALKDCGLSGNTLSILKQIDGVGKDFRLGGAGNCGKGQWVPVGDGGPPPPAPDLVVGGGT